MFWGGAIIYIIRGKKMKELAVTTAQKLYPEALQTIETLCTIDRGSMSLQGLAQTAEYLANFMRAQGCEVVMHPDETYGATVVGRKKGKGKAKILLYAHMDTVWPEGTCAERPFYIEGNFAYGPGVSDCTHGLITGLYTLKALCEMGIDNYGEIIFLFNPAKGEMLACHMPISL